ncbi:MAG: hypothetical protein B9S38_09590 [Verrucomicrobiia bacterium Tous-C4TDCM]|nr:MAG: hypothetical protein B9S38_09590 [Verrucomicrobiae bacterium Tous-C4TDCM]
MSRSQNSTLAALVTFVALNACANGALVTGTWVKASGATGMALTNTTTASPTWGDGTTDNADASSIYSPMTTITLANPGDKVVLSGSAQMFGITGTAGSIFRFGIFNVNGSANTNGWLGYFVQNAASGGSGSLQERALVNTTSFTSTSGGGSASLQTLPLATSALTSAVYDFSFTLERNALNGLIITTSLVRTSDSLEFAGASFTDTTVNAGAFTFDRVGFQGTTDLNADKIQLNNVDVTFSAVPEPSAALLGGLGMLRLLCRRRAIRVLPPTNQ